VETVPWPEYAALRMACWSMAYASACLALTLLNGGTVVSTSQLTYWPITDGLMTCRFGLAPRAATCESGTDHRASRLPACSAVTAEEESAARTKLIPLSFGLVPK